LWKDSKIGGWSLEATRLHSLRKKAPKSASEVLKGRGFKPRRTTSPKAYGTAGKPCPFKTFAPDGVFRSLFQAVPSH